jgi:putative nucleotidyltransferase with HDIG domain
MFSFLQLLLRQFGAKPTPQKSPNITIPKAIDERVTSGSSIPEVTVFNEIIDTSSLFYDQLFGIVDTDNAAGLNPLEKEILLKVEAVLARPGDIATNIVKLPDILNQVSTLINRTDYTAEQLAHLITQDPGLSADVIKLVNSALYCRVDHEVTSLQEAIVRLGGSKIKELVFTAIMQNITDIKPIYFKLFGEQLWEHSVTTALWAKKLAREAGADPDLAYFLGLIHDVGKIALFKIIIDEMNTFDPEFKPSSKLFRQMMTKHSVRLSALIAQAWLMPGVVVKALYEQVELASSVTYTEPAQLLYAANLYSEIHVLLQEGCISQEQANLFCSEHGLDIAVCIAGI